MRTGLAFKENPLHIPVILQLFDFYPFAITEHMFSYCKAASKGLTAWYQCKTIFCPLCQRRNNKKWRGREKKNEMVSMHTNSFLPFSWVKTPHCNHANAISLTISAHTNTPEVRDGSLTPFPSPEREDGDWSRPFSLQQYHFHFKKFLCPFALGVDPMVGVNYTVQSSQPKSKFWTASQFRVLRSLRLSRWLWHWLAPKAASIHWLPTDDIAGFIVPSAN